MSRYTREFDVKVRFDGEELVARCKAATTVQAKKLQDAKPEEADSVAALADCLRESIVSLSGINDAAGSAITIDEFLSLGYFMTAMLEVGSQWLTRSLPQKEAAAVGA